MTSTIPVPISLNLSADSRSFNWDLFKQSWINYEIATGLDEKPENKRIATLLSIIGPDALQVYNAFVWHQGEERTISSVLNKFEAYCKPKRNVSYERFIFMTMKQNKSELIEDYIVKLRNQAKNCNYEPLTDTLIRDALILGVNRKDTQECLLRENDPSLDRCIDIIKAAERAKQHVLVLSTDKTQDVEDMEVDKISQGNEIKKKCKFCGRPHKFGHTNCPAYGKDCFSCGGKNHFTSVCNKKNRVNAVKEEVDADEDFKI